MKTKKKEKCRITTLLSHEEREQLRELAWKSGRSMSSLLRYIVLQEIEINK